MSELETAVAGSVLEPVEHLLNRMRAAGIPYPGSVVRAGIAAGEVLWRAPLFAWGAGVNPVALLWAEEIQRMMVCADVMHDMPATTRALVLALDVVAGMQ
jgi:hypothetical protein